MTVPWQTVLNVAKQLEQGLNPNITFIGGVAAYAHISSCAPIASNALMSHDVDLVITDQEYSDLKELEAVSENKRLRKAQIEKDGVEVDIYPHSLSGLVVSSDQVIAYSEMKAGLRVACLPHLILLKLKAFEDRMGSKKGAKDESDILGLLICAHYTRPVLDSALFAPEDVEMLKSIVKGRAPLIMSKGNAKTASMIKPIALNSIMMLIK